MDVRKGRLSAYTLMCPATPFGCFDAGVTGATGNIG
jgi:hypothetical protein